MDFTFRPAPLVLKLVPDGDRARLAALMPTDTAPVSTVQRFLDEAGHALREPAIGVALAEAVPRGAYGWIEFIARLSPTIRGGMESVCRYYRLLNAGAEISPLDDGLEIRVPGRPDAWGRHLNEYTLALFHRVIRELQPDWRPTRVRFGHAMPDPVAVDRLSAWFGARPRFLEPTTALEGDPALLDRALPTADPALQQLLEQQARAVLKEQLPLAVLASRVRDELTRRLGKDDVGIDAVAQALDLSARTLQRRLKDEGLAYQDVLDAARRQLARTFLADRSLSVGEVSERLGYSEVRAFDRAFRRWTGTTPLAWRASNPLSPRPTAPM